MLGLYNHQALAVVLFAGLAWGVVSRLWLWRKKRLHWRFPYEDKRLLLQAVGRGFFWMALGAACLIVFPRSDEMLYIMVAIGVAWIARLLIELLQPSRPNLNITVLMVIGALVILVDVIRSILPWHDPVVILDIPFNSEWVIIQGGPSPLQNHHLSSYNQRYALDIMKLEDGKLFRDKEGNAMVWSWDEPLFSPVNGTIAVAKDNMEDSYGVNMVVDSKLAAGNYVVIETKGGYFVVMAHLRSGSLEVTEGQEVKIGDLIAKVGNSGNTTMAHLHIQVQTHTEIWHKDNRSVPFSFQTGPMLRRNDRITGRNPQHGK